MLKLTFAGQKGSVGVHFNEGLGQVALIFFSSVVKAPTLKKLIEFHRSSKVVGKGVGNF